LRAGFTHCRYLRTEIIYNAVKVAPFNDVALDRLYHSWGVNATS
jgi:hypothetical protein